MFKVILLAAGGAAGTLFRYSVSGWMQKLSDGWLPIGTLSVNVLGCLLMGLLFPTLTEFYLVRKEYQVALLIGVLGGFTTFSSFGLETFQLINDGQFLQAGGYVLLSNALGLAAVWIGYRLAMGFIGM